MKNRTILSMFTILMLTAVMVTAVAGTAEARYYDPALARFLSADSEEGPNRYAYVNNNPVNMVDPSGNSAVSCDENGMCFGGYMEGNNNLGGRLTRIFREGMFMVGPVGGLIPSAEKSALPVIWEKTPWLRAKLDHLDEVDRVWAKWSGTKSQEAGQKLLDVVGTEFPLGNVEELRYSAGRAARGVSEGITYSDGNLNYIVIGQKGMTSLAKTRATIAQQLSRVEDKAAGILNTDLSINKMRADEAALVRLLPQAIHNSDAYHTALSVFKHYDRVLDKYMSNIGNVYTNDFLPYLSRFGNQDRIKDIRLGLRQLSTIGIKKGPYKPRE